ncbi:MAG: hypothetical protein QOH12_2726 [Solirubrobacteraceae bacterium]|nr:hypothetical protein [Solirubrobacteraceae bacterium]
MEEEDGRSGPTGVADEELAAGGDVDGQPGGRVTRGIGDPGGERPAVAGGGDQRPEQEPAERRDLGCLAAVLEIADNRS